MFTPIQQILPSTVRAFGIQTETEAAIVCDKYRKLAQTLVHPEALEHTYAKTYKNKVLTIGVENPAWAQVINEKKQSICDTINAELGKPVIQSVKTAVVGVLPA